MIFKPANLLLGLLAGLILLPALALSMSVFSPDWEVWQHLAETVLLDYIVNSLLLALGVGVGSLILGVSLAWILTQYEVVGKSYWQWLVLLPLAMPAYIIAYTYTGMLDSSGPVQGFIRETFDLSLGDYWFPEVRSLTSAIILMSLVLYPYVFVLARTAFLEQSRSLFEASQSIGLSRWQYFYRVAIPMARPALFTGAALAMMEALADYGTVKYFGISTFTTGIFRTWFGLGSEQAAAQLSMLLSVSVLFLLLLERRARRSMGYATDDSHLSQSTPQKLTKKAHFAALMCLAIPVLVGFLLPFLQLVQWAVSHFQYARLDDFIDIVSNSLLLALVAAVLTTVVAIVLCYGQRLLKTRTSTVLVQLSSIGYAFPGTVIAVGVMIVLTRFDYWLNDTLGWHVGLLFSGTMVALLFAYVIRFVAVAINNIDSGLQRVTDNMDTAARSMGYSRFNVLKKIHLPLIRRSVLASALLVFVDVLKELPATLVFRPFDVNTLAVRAFELASDERLAEAALPSVSIVIVGLIPVIILALASQTNMRKG